MESHFLRVLSSYYIHLKTKEQGQKMYICNFIMNNVLNQIIAVFSPSE